MRSYIKFVRENMKYVKEYLGLQIFVFVYAKIYIFKDAYIEPMHLMVYGSWFFVAWIVLTVGILLGYLLLWYRSNYEIPKLTCSFINLSLVPASFLVMVRYFWKSWFVTGLLICYLIYTVGLLVANFHMLFRINNKEKKKRNHLLYIERMVKTTYHAGMILVFSFLVSHFLADSFSAFLPDPDDANNPVNESVMDWNEMNKALSEENWNDMSISQKISWLQIITDYTAKEYLGCNTVTVEIAPFGEKLWGCYSDAFAEESLYISSSLVKNGEAQDVVFTALHELFHHYEYECISEVNFNSNHISTLQYFDEVRKWKDNASSYVEADKEGYDAYVQQPLETSANEFAEDLTDIYFDKVQ